MSITGPWPKLVADGSGNWSPTGVIVPLKPMSAEAEATLKKAWREAVQSGDWRAK